MVGPERPGKTQGGGKKREARTRACHDRFIASAVADGVSFPASGIYFTLEKINACRIYACPVYRDEKERPDSASFSEAEPGRSQIVVRPKGLEPLACWTATNRSNPLSYGRMLTGKCITGSLLCQGNREGAKKHPRG